MKEAKQMWSLRGILKNKPYEEISHDIEYLKRFLTKLLRNGATGFIFRE